MHMYKRNCVRGHGCYFVVSNKGLVALAPSPFGIGRCIHCNLLSFEVCASLWASVGVIAVRPPCQSVDGVGMNRVTLFPMPVPWGNRCTNSRLSFATMSAPKNMSLPVLQGSVKNLATRFQRFVHIGFKLISKYDMI